MAPSKPLPCFSTPASVAGLLTGVLGRAIVVKRSHTPINLAVPAPALIAHYDRHGGNVAGVCICDLPLAANLAACLSLVPAGVASEAVRCRALSDQLMENYREILNIFSQIFLVNGGPRIAFGGTLPFPGTIPDAVRQIIFHPCSRLDVEVAVPKYGGGKMALRCAGEPPCT